MRQAGILQGHRCCSSSASPLLLNQVSQSLDKNRHCQIEKVHFCQCIVEHTAIQKDKLQNLAGFHAITGYDTTSNLAGHSKTTCLKVSMQHPYLRVHWERKLLQMRHWEMLRSSSLECMVYKTVIQWTWLGQPCFIKTMHQKLCLQQAMPCCST